MWNYPSGTHREMRWKIISGEVKRFFIASPLARDATFSYNQQVPGCLKPL
jgi:hypothetical protein